MIHFLNETDRVLPLAEEQNLQTHTTTWIRAVAATYGKKVGDINYIFCDDERILAVNREFLQHDYYTDIITFDYTSGNTLSGDLFISLDTVETNAQQVGTTFEEELYRIIIHGILHLTGQADKTPETRAEMTRKENLALNLLRTRHS